MVGLARRVERMQELSKKLSGESGKLYALKCDLSDEDEILKCFTWVENTLGGISILVNNAGIVQPTTLRG